MTIMPLSPSLSLRSSVSPNLPTITAAVQSLSASLPLTTMAEYIDPNSNNAPQTLTNYPKPISPPLPAMSKHIEQSRAMSASSRSSLFSLHRNDILFEDQWLIAVNKPQGVYSETILSSVNQMLDDSDGHVASNPGITLQLSAIKPLIGNNFEEWYESFNVHMTLHNLDLALRVDEPSKPIDTSSVDERFFYERWEHSNRICLMVMRYTMDKSIKECVPKMESAKDFLEYVKANYTKIDKVEMATYLKLLTTTTYDGVSGVRDHILKLRHYFNKANDMKVELSEKFLKWLILESLPNSFDVVKLTYNALKEEWTLQELTSIVVQHEVSLKKNETQTLALVTNQGSNLKKKFSHRNFRNSKQFKRKGDSSQGASNASTSSNATKNESFKGKCNFCHKIGHKKVDCFKFKNWLEKKKGDDKQKEPVKA